MNTRNVSKNSLKVIIIIAIISSIIFAPGFKNTKNFTNNLNNDSSVLVGYTVTSYSDANEKLYGSNKIEVFDSDGNSLGFYKTDFLEQVKIDGSGKGDGIENNGRFLHYDYEINDEKTYYLSDKSLGAYDNELIPWTGDKPSVAVNPPLPQGTKIKFIDIGSEAADLPDWVRNLLLTKTFYADDKFFLSKEDKDKKMIDVYVGLQKVKDMEGTPESLLLYNVKIQIIYANE